MTLQTENLLKGSLKLVVTLGLLAVAFRMIRFDTLMASLRHADYGLLALSALIILCGGFAGAAS